MHASWFTRIGRPLQALHKAHHCRSLNKPGYDNIGTMSASVGACLSVSVRLCARVYVYRTVGGCVCVHAGIYVAKEKSRGLVFGVNSPLKLIVFFYVCLEQHLNTK